jgi:hypothetical protein
MQIVYGLCPWRRNPENFDLDQVLAGRITGSIASIDVEVMSMRTSAMKHRVH